jgi:hypothetical protein
MLLSCILDVYLSFLFAYTESLTFISDPTSRRFIRWLLFQTFIYICLKIKPNSVRIRSLCCHIFVLPSTGFEPTPLIHCSTNRLVLCPAGYFAWTTSFISVCNLIWKMIWGSDCHVTICFRDVNIIILNFIISKSMLLCCILDVYLSFLFVCTESLTCFRCNIS